MILLWSLAGASAGPTGADTCLVVRQDAVTAADLAGAEPAFGALPPSTRIAWAPAPGLTRTLAPSELVRLGRAHGLAVSPRELCWQRKVEAIRAEDVEGALTRAAGGITGASMPEARITDARITDARITDARITDARITVKLLSFGPQQGPEGRPEFSLAALPRLQRPTPGAGLATPAAISDDLPTVLWRGRLVTSGGQAFPLWARVRLAQSRPIVVAKRRLKADEVIEAQDVERVERTEYPGWEAPVGEPALVIGRRVRRTIPARATVLPQLLAERREVERGDVVIVELPLQERAAGEDATQATLITQAESPGRKGAIILLQNPLTGRRFPSRVTGVGRAAMMPASPASRRQTQEVADARP